MRGFQASFYWFPWSIIIFPICWPLKTCPMPWHRPAASLLRSLPGACWWGYCLWAWVKPSGTNGPQVLWSFSAFNQLSLVIWLVKLRFGRCWWFWPILKSLQGQVSRNLYGLQQEAMVGLRMRRNVERQHQTPERSITSLVSLDSVRYGGRWWKDTFSIILIQFQLVKLRNYYPSWPVSLPRATSKWD